MNDFDKDITNVSPNQIDEIINTICQGNTVEKQMFYYRRKHHHFYPQQRQHNWFAHRDLSAVQIVPKNSKHWKTESVPSGIFQRKNVQRTT